MALRLRQLQAFEAVATTGSVTRAAASLSISQPAVSRLLSSFSDKIAFDLFIRKNGQLLPTQEARLLLGEVSRVLEGLKNIEELQHDLTERTAGHLRIACLPGFATSHLPNVVASFLEKRPDVTITIEPDHPERILEWIIGEQYDCGITDAFTGHPAIESITMDIRTVCIFPLSHRFSELSTITPKELDNERLIHARRDSYFFQALNEVFRNYSVRPKHIVETRQFTGACELVARNVGVAIVSELDARTYHGQLNFRPFTPNIPHQLSLVRPKHRTASMITLDFMEQFKASLEDLLV